MKRVDAYECQRCNALYFDRYEAEACCPQYVDRVEAFDCEIADCQGSPHEPRAKPEACAKANDPEMPCVCGCPLRWHHHLYNSYGPLYCFWCSCRGFEVSSDQTPAWLRPGTVQPGFAA